MPSILELPTVRRLVSPVSVELYHQTGEYNQNGRRTELVRGIIIEKMPKAPCHSILVDYLCEIICAGIGDGMYLRQEQPLTLTDSEPEPDVCVVRGRREDYTSNHPSTALLTIEVAVTTEELDRAKASLYAEAGVEEYWIVLAGRRQIQAHTSPREGAYTRQRLYTRNETLLSETLPTLRLELSKFFGA